MIIEDVIGFLRKVPAFQSLSDTDLKGLTRGISMEFYPSGAIITRQDSQASESLHVIKKGAVKVFVILSDGEEYIIDYRGEGDFFGYLSLMSEKAWANVVAVEDTICYLIDKEAIKDLLGKHQSFRDYYMKSFFKIYVDKTFQEMHDKSLLYRGGEKALFSDLVGNFASKDPISIPKDFTIKQAARIMCENKIGALIILDDQDEAIGILTDKDLRGKVVALERNVSEPVSNIMSSPLITIDEQSYLFEAVLMMVGNNIHHVVVADRGKVTGIITNHDLMIVLGTSPLAVVKDIQGQTSVEGLIPLAAKTNTLVSMLLKEGARASNIGMIITSISDRIFRKIVDLAHANLGKAPLPYCWITFGSEGRKEQTFRTDQDNALIYADPANDQQEARAREYFAAFTAFVRDSLIKCGLPSCAAGLMASNPHWCQSLETWKHYFSRWIASESSEEILKSLIFYDFRSLSGNVKLSEDLRAYMSRLLKEQGGFLPRMASAITKNRLPVGVLNVFFTGKGADHGEPINLKTRAVAPLVDTVRLFALEMAIPETSTVERIRALRERHPMVKGIADELEQAFEFVKLLLIHHQIRQISTGKPLDDSVDPSYLSNLEKKTLKETFQIIAKLQDQVAEHYKA